MNYEYYQFLWHFRYMVILFFILALIWLFHLFRNKFVIFFGLVLLFMSIFILFSGQILVEEGSQLSKIMTRLRSITTDDSV